MKNLKHISKFLSLVLRHKPEQIGLNMDQNGWVDVDELILKMNTAGNTELDSETLEEVVETNDKQRFSFNADHSKIRANQGHSVEIELNLPHTSPPEILFHGTIAASLDGIRKDGLVKRSRQHVHLSHDLETAVKVGSRRGKPVILKIFSGEMHRNNHRFYLSENGVWLCDLVPAEFIGFE